MQALQISHRLSNAYPTQRPQPDIRVFPGFTARLALDRRTRQEAFALRHASYLADGHIDPRPDGLFFDSFDDAENCHTLVVYRVTKPVASVRICVLDTGVSASDSSTIPASLVFPEEVDRLLEGTSLKTPMSRIVEINRLVRHPDFSSDQMLVFLLFRLAGYMILRHNPDLVLSCVRQNHVPFYKRLQFRNLAGPRPYHGVKFASHLLACFRERYDAVQASTPLLSISQAQRSAYDAMLWGRTVPVSLPEKTYASA